MSPQFHTHRKRNIKGIFTTNGEGRSSEGSTEQGKKFMGFDKTIAFGLRSIFPRCSVSAIV